MRRLWNWWRGEWDFVLIWAGIAIIGMLVAGAIGTTLDALSYARAYH